MRRFAGAVVVSTLTMLAAATVASSQAQRYQGDLWVGINGWGSVQLEKGLLQHRTVRCTRARCPAVNYLTRGPRAVIAEQPHTGWRFSHWRGACKSMRPKCSIDMRKVRPNAYGERNVHVSATFVPVAAGLTRGHPIPLGTTADVGRGWHVQVNSVTPNVQLSPPPASGAQYFAANVTITYLGGGSATPEDALTWQTIGSHNATYNPGSDPCPYPGPEPPLPTYAPVLSGQSVTGYVCWQIAANDATSLELYFGSGSLDYPGTTWFALHY
jgi:hypothetical protein